MSPRAATIGAGTAAALTVWAACAVDDAQFTPAFVFTTIEFVIATIAAGIAWAQQR